MKKLILWCCISTLLGACRHPSTACHLNNIAKNKEANGVVIERIEDEPNNHQMEHLILKGNVHFMWQDENYQDQSFYHKINIGDSIVKNRGNLEMHVYRSDTSFTIPLGFPCEE